MAILSKHLHEMAEAAGARVSRVSTYSSDEHTMPQAHI
jgi:hypothetical protein